MDTTNEKNALNNQEQPIDQQQKPFQEEIVVDATNMDSAVLKRLISEIDFEKENRIHSYNRTHNRHNRGR